MSLKLASTLLFLVGLILGPSSLALSQSATNQKPEMAQDDSNDDQLKGPITVKAVNDLIKEKKFDLAAKMIDAGIAEAGSDGNLAFERLRYPLSSGLGRLRENGKAYAQGEQYIRALLKQDAYAKVSPAFSALSRILRYANRAEQTESGAELATDTLDKAEQLIGGKPDFYFSMMQRLVPICVEQISKNGDEEAAEKILTEKLATIDSMKAAGADEIQYLIAKTKLLQSRVGLPSSTKESAVELKKFIDDSNAAHPDSIPLLTAYMRAETFMLSEMLNNYPHEAKTRIAALKGIGRRSKKRQLNLEIHARVPKES